MYIYRYFTDDLSYNKIASQSHTFIGWNTYYASSAIDRNASSCMVGGRSWWSLQYLQYYHTV